MRRILLLGVTALGLATAAVPASAAPTGHCSLVADNGYAFAHAPSFRGVLSGVFTDDTGAGLDVRCSVRVSGVEQAVATASGTGVAVAATVAVLWVDPADVVTVCWQVGWGPETCGFASYTEVPPQPVRDLVGEWGRTGVLLYP